MEMRASIAKASMFSKIAHEIIAQKRKYNGEPYYRHPAGVASLLYNWISFEPEDVIISAYLHDIVEDVYPINSFFSIDLIRSEFGEKIANIVLELTDERHEGNRAERHKLKLEKYKNFSCEAAVVKVADMIDNAHSIKNNDKKFFDLYSKECKDILDILKSILDKEKMTFDQQKLYCNWGHEIISGDGIHGLIKLLESLVN